MKTRPKRLIGLSAFLLAIAIGLPAQIMFLYGNLPYEWTAILGKLAPLNWLILVLAPLSAAFLYQASRWVFAALPMLALVVIYNNWLVGQVNVNCSPWMSNLSSLLFLGIIAFFGRKEVLPILLDPKQRWWMTPARWSVPVPIRVTLFAGKCTEIKSVTYDISEGGAFIPINYDSIRGIRSGSQCFVALPLPGLDYIQCRAEIVRSADAHGRYPSGVGIRFLGMGWIERKRLGRFLRESFNGSVPA